jgi:hypothetical protein
LAIFCRGRPHPVLLSRRNLDLLFQDLVCFPRPARFRAPSIAGPPKTQLRLHLPLSQVLIHLQVLTPHHSLVTTVSISCLEQPYHQLESCNVEYLTYSSAARPWLSIYIAGVLSSLTPRLIPLPLTHLGLCVDTLESSIKLAFLQPR